MRLALRELRRRPGRFVFATGMLTLLVLLLLLLGGLLDGLYRGSTGALRAQAGELLVFSAESRDSVIRSRISPEQRAVVARVDGVTSTRGLGVALVGARIPGENELVDAALWGYEGGVNGVPEPPEGNGVWADRRLEAQGAQVGDRLRLGPEQVPVRVEGFVDDTSFLLQGGLWGRPALWRQVLDASRPDARLGPGTFQVLAAATSPQGDPEQVAAAIDKATDGTTSTLTVGAAILAIPGVESQNTTFLSIIYTTLLVVGLVVALFFALLTLERSALYGVLKAIGASTTQLATGLFTQAVVTTTLAFVAGGLLAIATAAIAPAEIPVLLLPSRAGFTLAGVVLAAVLGSTISLRRLVRIDPATAVGGGA